MILDLLRDWGAWTWVVGGLVLMLLELLTPGVSLVWVGIAALFVGIAALPVDIEWPVQLLLFVFLSIVLIYAAGRLQQMRAARSNTLRLNERAHRLFGHSFPLSEPILFGVGRIRVENVTWGVAGPELPANTMVRVTGHDGKLLTVEPA